MEAQLIQQFGISFIDVSSYVGLAAAGVMTLNLFVGLLLSVQYSPVAHWPYRRIPLFGIHKWTGYGAFFLALLHPAWLPLAKAANFTVLAVFYPIVAPEQPVINGLGGLAAYTLIFVVITAFLRQRFQYAFWKKLHYASYVVIVSFLIHGVLVDPSLKPGTPVDFLDGGKIFVEACALLCVGLIAWRVTFGKKLRLANTQAAAAQRLRMASAWRGRLSVAKIIDVSPDVKTFRLIDLDGKRLPFDFRPGQYLSFRINDGERSFIRNYSISSAPNQPDFCDISVRRQENGRGSTWLHTNIEVGESLDCQGPHGTFTFTGAEATSLVMIAGGIGITPLLSVLRHLAARNWPHDVYLLFAVRTPADILFRDELADIKRHYPRLKLLILPTHVTGFEWHGPHGLITAEILAGFVPQLQHRRVHLCGPGPMMEAATALLRGLGVPDAQIYTESFGRHGDVEGDDRSLDATVTFTKSGKTCFMPAGATLLDAAEEAGAPIDSSCRAGTCGSCKVKVVAGEVRMHRDDALTGRDVRERIVLACQARPMTSEISLEA
ncbi:MAG: 2Fe-2S iron-sulfur cluster binding domain-containing protein [Burkholderiaceae bacterium]|nr:2Fe-2S iron-sulfur cluster binding domain-containing protein [Burkholderiaceae bacterium]